MGEENRTRECGFAMRGSVLKWHFQRIYMELLALFKLNLIHKIKLEISLSFHWTSIELHQTLFIKYWHALPGSHSLWYGIEPTNQGLCFRAKTINCIVWNWEGKEGWRVMWRLSQINYYNSSSSLNLTNQSKNKRRQSPTILRHIQRLTFFAIDP